MLYMMVLIVFIMPLNTLAQNGRIVGTLFDPIRDIGIAYAGVKILRADSVVVSSSMSLPVIIENQDDRTDYSLREPATFELAGIPEGQYILKIVKNGYNTLVQTINVKYSGRDKICDLGEIWLEKETVQLPTAVVKGSRLLVVNKGDTLVYNVGALLVADGDMLSELVRKLPDTEIKDGKIYVRGKYIENLLIGGKDFFNGDIAQALRSLPAYTVNKIKVYNKAGEASELTGVDKGDYEYVMDVVLKKNFNGQWQGTLQAQGGTHQRYDLLGRLLRFDDRQAVVVVGEANNLGEVVSMLDPVWYGRNQDRNGNVFMKSLYSSYKFEPNKKLNFGARGALRRYHEYNFSYSASEVYLEQSNLFSRSDERSNAVRTETVLHTNLRWRPWRRLSLGLKYDLTYNRTRNTSISRQMGALINPDDIFSGSALDSVFSCPPQNQLLQQWVQTMVKQENYMKSNVTQHHGSIAIKQALGKNLLNLNLDFNHNNTGQNKYNLYDLAYPNTAEPSDYRHRYYDDGQNTFKWNGIIDYSFNYIDRERTIGQITPYYSYSYDYNYTSNPLYRLDWLESERKELMWLPSETNFLLSTLDSINTTYSWMHKSQHEAGFKFSQDFRIMSNHWLRFSGNIPINISRAYENYEKNFVRMRVVRNATFFNPSIALRFTIDPNDRLANKRYIELSYANTHSTPYLMYLIDVVDDSNPLNIVSGNPNLRNTYSQKWKLMAKLHKGKIMFWNMSMNYNTMHHAVAFKQSYSPATGVVHQVPVNVDGNKMFNTDNNFAIALNNQSLFLSGQLSWTYIQSKDLNVWETDAFGQESMVRTSSPQLSMSVQYHINKNLRTKFSVRGNWDHLSSSSSSFTPIDAYRISYQLETEATLPWKISLKSNIDVESRFGYSDRSMNKTIWLWNVRLEKSAWKSLSFTFDAYDILNQYKGVTATLNAQGRTETYRKSQPSYFLLGLTWRFHKKRK